MRHAAIENLLLDLYLRVVRKAIAFCRFLRYTAFIRSAIRRMAERGVYGNIMWGIVFLLAGVVLVWLGIRQRKRAQRDYEDDVRRYTASTVMTVVHLDESVLETWEDRDDGGRELRRETVYQPTYEYTVDGKTYRYASRQCVSSRDMGRQVTGYYDPADPSCITENRPRKPILGGFFFFAFAAFLLFFAYWSFTGELYIS